MDQCCENCRFWKQTRWCGDKKYLAVLIKFGSTQEEAERVQQKEDELHGNVGLCRRFPGIPLLWDGELDARQPHMLDGDWCGEWQPKGGESSNANSP